MTLAVRLLGPVAADVDGRAVELGGPRPRALLAVLAAADGAVVAAGQLIEAVWSDTGRAPARTTLHVHVHAVRRALEPAGCALVHTTGGYRLDGVRVDVRRAEDRISAARAADRSGDPAGAAEAYREALALWRGDFCADLPHHRALEPARVLYASMRLEALEARIGADLRRGARDGLVSELDALVAAHPLRERLWGRLMVALYADGRPADALACYRRARAVLAGEAGLDPGTALRELEAAVLARAGTSSLLAVAVPGAVGAGRATLHWVDDGGVPRTRALGTGRVVIGRDRDADVVLRADPAVSRRHAAIVPAGGRWSLTDLGSRNGTRLNGVAVGEPGAPLSAGDLLRCGDTVLAVTDGRPAAVTDGDTRPPAA